MNAVAKKMAELEIQQASEQLADKYSHEAYMQLCKKWGITADTNIEQIFRAGFASGGHAATSVIVESAT